MAGRQLRSRSGARVVRTAPRLPPGRRCCAARDCACARSGGTSCEPWCASSPCTACEKSSRQAPSPGSPRRQRSLRAHAPSARWRLRLPERAWPAPPAPAAHDVLSARHALRTARRFLRAQAFAAVGERQGRRGSRHLGRWSGGRHAGGQGGTGQSGQQRERQDEGNPRCCEKSRSRSTVRVGWRAEREGLESEGHLFLSESTSRSGSCQHERAIQWGRLVARDSCPRPF